MDGPKSVHSHAIIADTRYTTPRIQSEDLVLGRHRDDVEIRPNPIPVQDGGDSHRYLVPEQVGSTRPSTTSGQTKDRRHDTHPPIPVFQFGVNVGLNAENGPNLTKAPITSTFVNPQSRIRERIDQDADLSMHNAPMSISVKNETDSDMARIQERMELPIVQPQTNFGARKDPLPDYENLHSQFSVQESAAHGHTEFLAVEPFINNWPSDNRNDFSGAPPTKEILVESQGPFHANVVQGHSGLEVIRPATSLGFKDNKIISSVVCNAPSMHNRQIEDVAITLGASAPSQTPRNDGSPKFSSQQQSNTKPQVANIHRDQTGGVDLAITSYTDPPVIRPLDETAMSPDPHHGVYATTISVGSSIVHNTTTPLQLRPDHRELEATRRAGYDMELATQQSHVTANPKQVDLVSRQYVANTPVMNSAVIPSDSHNSKKLLKHGSPDSRCRTTAFSRPAEPRGTVPSNASQANAPPTIQVQTAIAVSDPSPLAPDRVPQLKIRHPIKEFNPKQAEVGVKTSRNAEASISVIPIPTSHTKVNVTNNHEPSPEQEVRAIELSRKDLGYSKDDSQYHRRLEGSPDTKSYKIEDVHIPVASPVDLSTISQDNVHGPDRLNESSANELPSKQTTNHQVNQNHGITRISCQKTEVDLLRSVRPALQQLPMSSDQTGLERNITQTPHPKIHHPVLSEILSSPPPRKIVPVNLLLSPSMQGTSVYEQRDVKALRNGSGDPDQSKLRDPSQELSKLEIDARRPVEEVQASGNRAGRIQSNSRSAIAVSQSGDLPTIPLLLTESSNQLPATRTPLHGSIEQSGQDARDQKKAIDKSYPARESREKASANHETTSQTSNLRGAGVSVSRNLIPSQPLPTSSQKFSTRQLSASIPASGRLTREPLRTATPAIPQDSHNRMRSNPDYVQSPLPRAPSEETILLTPSSLNKTLALKPTPSRQSNAGSVDSKTGKKVGLLGRFMKTSTKTAPGRSYETWHPNSSSKTPESSPGHSKGITALHDSTTTLVTTPNTKTLSNTAHPNSVSIPDNPPVTNVFTPFKYLTSKKNRSISLASMEARDGRAVSHVFLKQT